MDPSETDPTHSMRCGDTLLDTRTHILPFGDRQCPLAASEFLLLQLLFRQPNLLLPKATILGHLFKASINRPSDRIFYGHLHRVRTHLRLLDSNLSITTRRDVGWTLVVPTPDQPLPRTAPGYSQPAIDVGQGSRGGPDRTHLPG